MIELRILRKQLDGGVADQLQYRATKEPGRFIEGMGWVDGPPENKWQDVPVVTEDPSIK